ADLFERAGPLIMVTVEAAGVDPIMRRIADEGARATAANFAALARALADHGALRPGLEPDQAADVLFALASPHVHHLLRHERGWRPRDPRVAWRRGGRRWRRTAAWSARRSRHRPLWPAGRGWG